MTSTQEISTPAFPDYPCVCHSPDEAREGCRCPREERALRTLAYTKNAQPMTSEQREWCKREIVSVEGYSEKDAEGSDADVARTVLNAWDDSRQGDAVKTATSVEGNSSSPAKAPTPAELREWAKPQNMLHGRLAPISGEVLLALAAEIECLRSQNARMKKLLADERGRTRGY